MSRRMRLQVRPNVNRAPRETLPKVPIVEIKIEDTKDDEAPPVTIKEEDTKPDIVLLQNSPGELLTENSDKELISDIVVEEKFIFLEPAPVPLIPCRPVVEHVAETAIPPVSLPIQSPPPTPPAPTRTDVLQSILTSPVRLIQRPKVEPQQKSRKAYIKGKEPPEKSKMTMMDLIYWNPTDNPMPAPDKKENCTPDETESEEPTPKDEMNMNFINDEEADLLAPKLKIGPNNEIIIDEESLVIHQKRPEDYLVVHEDHATNYSSFRQKPPSEKWTKADTIKFYKALSVVGTDFALMASLLAPRTRLELKLKYKSEEKRNNEFLHKILNKPDLFDVKDFESELEAMLGFFEKESTKKKPIKQRRRHSQYKAPSEKKLKRTELSPNDLEKNNDTELNVNNVEQQSENLAMSNDAPSAECSTGKKLKGKRGRKPKRKIDSTSETAEELNSGTAVECRKKFRRIKPNIGCTEVKKSKVIAKKPLIECEIKATKEKTRETKTGAGKKMKFAPNVGKKRNPPPGLYDIDDEDSDSTPQIRNSTRIRAKRTKNKKDNVVVTMEECQEDSQKIILLSETGDVLPYDLVYDDRAFSKNSESEVTATPPL